MSELAVEIVQLTKITPHPNADTLSLTKMWGYPVVIRTDEWTEGDLAVYFPVDSIVPERPEFEFMWRHKECPTESDRRVKAVKLRGYLSMGLLIPARMFPEVANLPVGTNVADLLGVGKYQPPPDIVLGGDNEATPPWFQHYTEIENLRKYHHVFEDGEPLIATEKIHGCFRHGTRIRLANGKTKVIEKIEVGDYVVGRDKEGSGDFVPSKVLATPRNGRTSDWLRIEVELRGMNRGNSTCVMYCTPEHKIFHCNSPDADRSNVRGEWVEARTLKEGDFVMGVRGDVSLTPIQEQILLGLTFGDGSFHDAKNETGAITWGHKEDHREYNEMLAKALDSIARHVGGAISGYGTKMSRYSTIYSHAIYRDFLCVCSKTTATKSLGAKRIPRDIIDRVGPIAIAVWYMDDGSLTHSEGQEDRVVFHTCRFDDESCANLVEVLKKFGIQATAKKLSECNRIVLNADNAEKLFLLVAPYVPKCMQYKLPSRYRGHRHWMPDGGGKIYKPMAKRQRILSVEKHKESSTKYDLTTSTGNYVVSNVLVHNSNGRWAFKDGRLWVGSHGKTKKLGADDVWNKVAVQYELAELLAKYQNTIFFGEVYGSVQKGFHYGRDRGLDLVIFDILDLESGKYIDWDDTKSICQHLGLECVPEVIPAMCWRPERTFSECERRANGESLLARRHKAEHIREGLVIRPLKERFDPEIGRVILKLHGEDFLVGKRGKNK